MGSFKKDMISGVFYVSLAKYSNIVVQLIVTAILARLLTPEDYGIVAISTVFIAFFNLLSDIGIGPAIIQYKDLNRNDLSNIFTLTAYVGMIMATLFFVSSQFIANYYHNDYLTPTCRLLCITIVFHCLNIVPQNLQYKRKRFKFIAVVTLFSSVISALGGIILAFWGFGVYALVTQQILAVFLLFVLNYKVDKLRLRICLNLDSLNKIFSFSLYQFLFNIINYFSRNLDKLLIGRFIGFAPLGQYEKSYRLMLMPLQNISFVITPVIQPVFSNYQNDFHEIAEKYKQIFSLLCYIGFPLSVFLFFSGKELILLFFGDQWNEAIAPFRILSLTVGLQILNGTSGAIYQSANATKQLFISGCWCAFFMISSFMISILGWGTIVAVSIGYVIAQVFNSVQTYYLLFKTLRYPISRIIPLMLKPILIALGLSILMTVFSPLFASFNLVGSFLLKGIISFVFWIICMRQISPYQSYIRDVKYKFKRKQDDIIDISH